MQTVWVNCHKRNSGPVNFIVESCLPLSCTNQFCARKPESGVLKMVQQIKHWFLFGTFRPEKTQGLPFKMVSCSRKFFYRNHTKSSVPFIFLPDFPQTFFKWQTTLTSSLWNRVGRKEIIFQNRMEICGYLARWSLLPCPLVSFTLRKQTTSGLLQRVAIGDVLYAQAGFGQTGSKPVKKSVSTCGGGAEASRRKL